MRILNRKIKYLQITFAVIVSIIYLNQMNFFSTPPNLFFRTLFLFILRLIVTLLISNIIDNICIALTKILYAYRHHVTLTTISIFPFIIECHPFSIKLQKFTDALIYDLTNVKYVITNTDDEARCNLLHVEIPFHKSIKYHFLLILIVSILFFYHKDYGFGILLLGVAITNYMLALDDTKFFGISNVIPFNDSHINLLRLSLKHSCIEIFNKRNLYDEVFRITPITNMEFFYHHNLVIEAIIDSILDNQNYLNPLSYKNYLRKNVKLIDGHRPDTIKILRYFFIMNYLDSNKTAMQEIKDDIQYQMTFIEHEPLLLNYRKKLCMRWMEELESLDFDLLADEKSNEAIVSSVFCNKRIKLTNMLRQLN